MTRYHHLVGLLNYLGYKETGYKVLGVCRLTAHTIAVCNYSLPGSIVMLWLTDDSILVTLEF